MLSLNSLTDAFSAFQVASAETQTEAQFPVASSETQTEAPENHEKGIQWTPTTAEKAVQTETLQGFDCP